MKIPSWLAGAVNAAIMTYFSIALSGAIPDGKWTHAVNLGVSALSTWMTFMGYNRTPNGTVIPSSVQKAVDVGGDIHQAIKDTVK